VQVRTDTSVAHPGQERDDKVTVSRSSPRSRARSCDPNGSLRAVHANANVRWFAGRCADWQSATRIISCEKKEDDRTIPRERRKNGRKVGGGRECVYSASSSPPPILCVFSLASLGTRRASLSGISLNYLLDGVECSPRTAILSATFNCIAIRYIVRFSLPVPPLASTSMALRAGFSLSLSSIFLDARF